MACRDVQCAMRGMEADISGDTPTGSNCRFDTDYHASTLSVTTPICVGYIQEYSSPKHGFFL